MSTRSCIARKLDAEAVKKAREVAPAKYAEHLKRVRARRLLRAARKEGVSDLLLEGLKRGGK